MLPTPIHYDLTALRPAYPEPARLLAAVRAANETELEAICRLWLTEGIPAVFDTVPLHYEHLRHSVAGELKISERSISMVGSARLGYSYSPKKFGSRMRPDSDIDLFIVDKKLLDGCMDAAQQWRDDVVAGRVNRKGALAMDLKKRREMGFINSDWISAEYQPIGRIGVAVRNAQRQLENLGHPHKVSARIYVSWERALKKICFDVRDLRNMPLEAPGPQADQ